MTTSIVYQPEYRATQRELNGVAPSEHLDRLLGSVVYSATDANSLNPDLDVEPGRLKAFATNIKMHALLEAPCPPPPHDHPHDETCMTWVDAEKVRYGGDVLDGFEGSVLFNTGRATPDHLIKKFCSITSKGLTLFRTPGSSIFSWHFAPQPVLNRFDETVQFINRPVKTARRIHNIHKHTNAAWDEEDQYTREFDDFVTPRQRRYIRGAVEEVILNSSDLEYEDISTRVRIRIGPATYTSINLDSKLIRSLTLQAD